MNNAMTVLFNFVTYLTHMSIRGGAAGSTQAFLETHQLDIHFNDLLDGNILMMVIVRGSVEPLPDNPRAGHVTEIYTKSVQTFILPKSQLQLTLGTSGWTLTALPYITAICDCYMAPEGLNQALQKALMGDHLYTRIQYKKNGITVETDDARRGYKEGVSSTAFARFIREASVEEKEKVYGQVIDGAITRQNAVLSQAGHPKLSNNGANENV